MKIYYEVNENSVINYNGKRVNGSKVILTTKSRAKAFKTLNEKPNTRWIDEITDYGSGETVDTIA